jgi:hypothetical protein
LAGINVYHVLYHVKKKNNNAHCMGEKGTGEKVSKD